MTRILLITSAWPLGRSFGGQIRAFNTAEALAALGSVSIQVVGNDASDAESRRCTEAAFEVHAPVLPLPTPNIGLAAKLRWAVQPRNMNAHGCTATPADQSRVRALGREHDLVWVLNARTPNLLGIWSWQNAHLDADDLPSTYQRALAKSASSWIAKLKAHFLQKLFRRRELLLMERFQTLSVCSEEDRTYLGGSDRIHVIPNGFRRPSAPPTRNVLNHPPRLGFIGLYNYAPNREGIRWFLDCCWPRIRRAVPEVRLRLVGEGTDGKNCPTGKGVEPMGWLNDPSEEIATWSAMIVPIRFGGGTRIKIAEGFSRKCPVVSTRLGAFGYGVEDGRQLRLADEPETFAEACVNMIARPGDGAAMAERAWTEFLEKWTWTAQIQKIHAAAAACLALGERPLSPSPITL